MLDAPQDHDTPLMQDPAFAVALRLCGQNPVILPTGHILLQRRILGVRIAMLPRAAPHPDLWQHLRALGLQRIPLILSPEHPCTLPRAMRLRGSQNIAQLQLHPDRAVARATLHAKWRNQLKRAEAAHLRVTDGPMPSHTDHHPLLILEAAQARARGYTNWPNTLTAAFAKAAPDQTRLFMAYAGNTVVAHALFLLHGRRATYHIAHITKRGKALCAHNLLLWRASRWLAEQGHNQLDLGLVDPRTPGLNRFKLRTGAHLSQTGGTWLRWHPLAPTHPP